MQKGQFNGFATTSMSDWKIDIKQFHSDQEISDILNNCLNLKVYTNLFKQILFISMAITPETKSFRLDKKIMRRKFQTIELYINVPDYNKFRTATKPEARKIIAKLYLSGIKKYLSKQKNFKHELFYKDVKELFEKEGIL